MDSHACDGIFIPLLDIMCRVLHGMGYWIFCMCIALLVWLAFVLPWIAIDNIRRDRALRRLNIEASNQPRVVHSRLVVPLMATKRFAARRSPMRPYNGPNKIGYEEMSRMLSY